MPEYDIFGEPIYSKEELAAMKKAEAEEKKRNLKKKKDFKLKLKLKKRN